MFLSLAEVGLTPVGAIGNRSEAEISGDGILIPGSFPTVGRPCGNVPVEAIIHHQVSLNDTYDMMTVSNIC